MRAPLDAMGAIISTPTGGIPLNTSTQQKVTKNIDQDRIDQIFAPVDFAPDDDRATFSESDDDSQSSRNNSALRQFKIRAENVSYGSARKFTIYRESATMPSLMEARFKSTGYFMNTGEYQLYQHHISDKKCLVGRVVSNGWTSSQMNIEDAWKNHHGAVRFENNYSGTLMRFSCRLPKRADLDRVQLAWAISKTSRLVYDISYLIAGFLTPTQTWVTHKVGRRPWTSDEAFYSPHFAKVADTNHLRYKLYHNKTPEWNADVNAYTLEFGGRALLPSVHNFQLVGRREESESEAAGADLILLQLGKVGYVADHIIFNCDIAPPLSLFHAFAIAICVLQRTYIHE